jgi:enoyl-CoA hydratase/carnithine racemase
MTQGYSLLIVEHRKEICFITINRVKDRNAINTALMEELDRALTETEATSARAVVFSGAGESHFIGGADGIEMMQLDAEGAKVFSQRIQGLFNRMEASPLILASAINGLCFGGGYEFALACDFRIAGESARIGLPEVKVGLIPGGGGTQRLPQVVGLGRALEMILSGRLYKAEEALTMGLIHHLAPADHLLAETAQFLGPILKNPPYALSQAKRTLRSSQGRAFSEGLRIESEEFQKCFNQTFFKELMRHQIKTGQLTTTSKLPDWVYEEGGNL